MTEAADTNYILDSLTAVPTILVPSRLKRADETGSFKTNIANKKVEKGCFFCKGNEALTPPTIYQDADDWNVRVFANKFPVFKFHEVIAHGPTDNYDIGTFPVDHVVKIIKAFIIRINYYYGINKEVYIFNNRGGKAGASIVHPHSQLVAAYYFPGRLDKKRTSAFGYEKKHHSCYWCDLIRSEMQKKDTPKSRILYETEHNILIAPEASRWSYEMTLLPKMHQHAFSLMTESEIVDLSTLLSAALRSYDVLFDNSDRNFWIHTLRTDPFHWHLEFLPQIKVFGGVELGAGIWVSDKASPEKAAKELGEYVKKYYEEMKFSITND